MEGFPHEEVQRLGMSGTLCYVEWQHSSCHQGDSLACFKATTGWVRKPHMPATFGQGPRACQGDGPLEPQWLPVTAQATRSGCFPASPVLKGALTHLKDHWATTCTGWKNGTDLPPTHWALTAFWNLQPVEQVPRLGRLQSDSDLKSLDPQLGLLLLSLIPIGPPFYLPLDFPKAILRDKACSLQLLGSQPRLGGGSAS